MKSIICCIILFIVCATVICTNNVPCGSGSCPADRGCCVWTPTGSNQVNQCFDRNAFSCTNDEGIPGQKCLCSTGQQCCSKACYNPSMFACVPNQGDDGSCLCSPNQGCCNGHCFDRSTRICIPADNQPGTTCLCELGVHDKCYIDASNQHPVCYNSNTNPVCTGQVPYVTVINSGSNCGAPTTLTCSVTGAGPFHYQWTTSNGGSIAGPSNTMSIHAASTGTYTCTATGASNCPGSDSITISSSSIQSSITASPSTSSCSPITLTCATTGCTGSISYVWTTTGGAIAGSIFSQTIVASKSGMYNCVATDSTGCSASSSISVSVGKLTAVISENDCDTCDGPVTLTCNPNNANGAVMYNWMASNGGMISSATNIQTITATSSGTYMCTITDTLCTTSATYSLVRSNLNVVINAPTTTSCRDALPLQCAVTGATGPITYSWTTTDGGLIMGATNGPTISASTTGNYICTVNDGSCTRSDSQSVVISKLSAAVTPNSAKTCYENKQLTCSVTGAVGNVNYAWMASAGGIISGSNTGNKITATTSGVYTCKATDSLCMSTASGTLDANDCSCLRFKIELNSLIPQCSTGKSGVKAVLHFDFAQSGLDVVLKLKIQHPLDSIVSKLVGIAFDMPKGVSNPRLKSLGSIFNKLWSRPLLAPYGILGLGVSPSNILFDLLGLSDGLKLGVDTNLELTFPNCNADDLAAKFFAGFSDGTLRSVGKFQLPGLLGILPITDKVLGKLVVCLL